MESALESALETHSRKNSRMLGLLSRIDRRGASKFKNYDLTLQQLLRLSSHSGMYVVSRMHCKIRHVMKTVIL